MLAMFGGLIMSVCGLSVPALANDKSSRLPNGNWQLVFSDEFDGRELNPNKWTKCYWWENNGCTNLGNNELQWYMHNNVDLAGGHLRLQARRERVRGHEGRPFDYTSGIVTTGRHYEERAQPDRFATRFGYFEIRAKVPKGKGLWPAIWLLPSTQKPLPEIDIMEVLGHATNVLQLHIHYDDDGEPRNPGVEVRTSDLSSGWRTYGLDWSRDAVAWYLDGREVWRYEERAHIPDEPMYLLLNLAVGGDWPGAPDGNTVFPADFLIDYVRVWRRAGP